MIANAFLQAIAGEPHEDVHRLAFADWLDEYDRLDEAREQRLCVALRRVIAAPADNAPRLEYAAVCEAYGQPGRAEFCRVQCELDRWFDPHEHAPRAEPLRRRERELLNKHYWEWLPVEFRRDLPARPDIGTEVVRGSYKVEFRRGFVASVTLPLSAWVGERCWRCERYSRISECHVCHGSGVTGRCGPLLVRAAPLEEVTLSDVHVLGPAALGYERCPWYFEEDYGGDHASLPTSIFNLLADYITLSNRGSLPRSRQKFYATRQAALNALSAACLRWAVYAAELEDMRAKLKELRSRTDTLGRSIAHLNADSIRPLIRREAELAALVG